MELRGKKIGRRRRRRKQSNWFQCKGKRKKSDKLKWIFIQLLFCNMAIHLKNKQIFMIQNQNDKRKNYLNYHLNGREFENNKIVYWITIAIAESSNLSFNQSINTIFFFIDFYCFL